MSEKYIEEILKLLNGVSISYARHILEIAMIKLDSNSTICIKDSKD